MDSKSGLSSGIAYQHWNMMPNSSTLQFLRMWVREDRSFTFVASSISVSCHRSSSPLFRCLESRNKVSSSLISPNKLHLKVKFVKKYLPKLHTSLDFENCFFRITSGADHRTEKESEPSCVRNVDMKDYLQNDLLELWKDQNLQSIESQLIWNFELPWLNILVPFLLQEGSWMVDISHCSVTLLPNRSEGVLQTERFQLKRNWVTHVQMLHSRADLFENQNGQIFCDFKPISNELFACDPLPSILQCVRKTPFD